MEAYGFIKMPLKELKDRIEKIQNVLIPYNKKIDEEYNELLVKETFEYNNFKFLGIFKRRQLNITEYALSIRTMFGMLPSKYYDILYKAKNIPNDVLNLIKFGTDEDVYLSTDCINDIIRLETFFNIKDDSGYRPQVLLKG